MKRFFKSIFITTDLLGRFAGKCRKALIAQVIVYSFIVCYDIVIVPVILSAVFNALEKQDMRYLDRACIGGALLVVFSFLLSYFNNVYLDLNSFRIQLSAARNVCKEMFGLSYDKLEEKYGEGEILNRIDSGAGNIAPVFPLIISILTNIIGLLLLLLLAGKSSTILVVITLAVVGAGYLATRFETERKTYFEKHRQKAEDMSGAAMHQAVKNQAVLKMYGMDKVQWENYRSLREYSWNERWNQERAGLITGCGMEAFISAMRAVLGWGIFRMSYEHLLNSGKVASSFSVFDQLKSIATDFSRPISNVGTSMVSVGRLNELLQEGEADSQKGKEIFFQNDNNFLAIDRVTYVVGERQILNGITMAVNRGEKVALIGKNGCGKSTLLRVIGGLNHPTEGKVTLMGIDPGVAGREELRHLITYIPSENRLYNGSIEENIVMNLNNEDNIDFGICDAVGVTRFREKEQEDKDIWLLGNRDVSELSGGQARRVNIARGLVHKVPVLLADEPDAGLPPAQGRYILENLLSFSETAIIVTHHHEYLSLFDRVILLEDGIASSVGGSDANM